MIEQNAWRRRRRLKNVSRSVGISRIANHINCVDYAIIKYADTEFTAVSVYVLTLPKQVNDALDKINSIQLEDSTTVAILKNALEEGNDNADKLVAYVLMTQVNSLMLEPDKWNLQCYQQFLTC